MKNKKFDKSTIINIVAAVAVYVVIMVLIQGGNPWTSGNVHHHSLLYQCYAGSFLMSACWIPW